MWQNSIFQNLTQFRNPKCDKTQKVTTQKIKIVTELKNPKCDKTQKIKM